MNTVKSLTFLTTHCKLNLKLIEIMASNNYADNAKCEKTQSHRGGQHGTRGSSRKFSADAYSSHYEDTQRGGYRGYRTGSGRYRSDPPDVQLSKKLSKLLRHQAEHYKLKISPEGFIDLEDILKLQDFKGFTEKDIQRIVDDNDKKRFTLETPESGKKRIKANQGHSIKLESLQLEEITLKDLDKYPMVVHGTYHTIIHTIWEKGLNKMSRNHIHFAPGVPGEDEVISGMRGSCDVIISIDLKKALEAGIKFYKSPNNVILTEGDHEGSLSSQYFKDITDRQSKESLMKTFMSEEKKTIATGQDHELSSSKRKKQKKRHRKKGSEKHKVENNDIGSDCEKPKAEDVGDSCGVTQSTDNEKKQEESEIKHENSPSDVIRSKDVDNASDETSEEKKTETAKTEAQ